MASTSASNPTLQRRCGHCRRSKQECTFTDQQGECDRCIKLGYKCLPPPKGSLDAAFNARSLYKCDYCRTAHESCFPKGREWPDKCDYCIARKLPCSKPRTKGEYMNLRDAEGTQGAGSASGTEALQPTQRPRRAPKRKIVLVSDVSESDDPSPPAVTTPKPSKPPKPSKDPSLPNRPKLPSPPSPPKLPSSPKKRKTNSKDPEPSIAEQVEQLKNTIRNMEAEFKEVLKSEQEKHKKEIEGLKGEHQKELNAQRHKYEQRIDDLIKIMKNF